MGCRGWGSVEEINGQWLGKEVFFALKYPSFLNFFIS